MRLVCVKVNPKWPPRHVTSCPAPINPEVTPAMARSPLQFVEAMCKSTLRARSKQRSIGRNRCEQHEASHPIIRFTSAWEGAPSIVRYVPELFSSSAILRSKPRVARIGAEPRLTRATPNFSSSGIEGELGPPRIFLDAARQRRSAGSFQIPRPREQNSKPAPAQENA